MPFWLIALAPVGGLLNRWRGGWLPGFGGATTRRLILAAATTAFMLTLAQPALVWETALLAGAFWLLSWLGWIPGWGSYMDMGHMPDGDNEFLRPLLDLFFDGTEASVTRDFVGMTVRGLVVTGPAGAVLAYWYLGPGLVYALSGLAMGAIYLLGWKIYDAGGFSAGGWAKEYGGTVANEFMFGTWLWGALYTGFAT